MRVIVDPSKFVEYGFKQSKPDYRDFQLMNLMKGVAEIPPEKKYISARPLKIKKQLRGSCTGQSTAYLKEIQEMFNHPGKNYEFSADWAYDCTKDIDGNPNEGAEMRYAMKVPYDTGIALESSYPSDANNIYSKIEKKALRQNKNLLNEAAKFRIGAYAKVMSLNEIKLGIKTGHGVKVGQMVTDSYVESEKGVIPCPAGYFLGGHDTCFIGWDDDMTFTFKNGKKVKGCLIFVNSWGDEWGDNGYGYLPYELLTWRTDFGMPFFMEAWTSVDVIMPNPTAEKITIWIDKERAVIDGQETCLEQPPTITKETGRTLVPVRFLAENLGFTVLWDGVERRIDIINSNK